MDIIRNSIAAQAGKISIVISADVNADELVIEVADNGTGMDEEQLGQVVSPFTTSRTTRKVGLGIPLFEASARRAQGYLTIESARGAGTDLKAHFKISHIDRPPLGDVAETIRNIVMSEPQVDIELVLKKEKTGCVRFDTQEVRQQLGEVPINRYEVLDWIRDYVEESIKTVFGGVLNEIDR